jgi:hypothetical protein
MIGKRLENEESAAPFHYGDHIIDADMRISRHAICHR